MEKIKRIGTFLWIRNIIFENKNLNGSDIMTYASLIKHMNNDTKECYPSIKLISKEARINKRTVYKSLDILEKEKLIFRKRGRGRVNRYIILEPPSSVETSTTEKEGKGSEKEGKPECKKRETNYTSSNYTNITRRSNSSFNKFHKKQRYDKNNDFPMRQLKKNGKWYDIPPDGSEWLEFTGDIKNTYLK